MVGVGGKSVCGFLHCRKPWVFEHPKLSVFCTSWYRCSPSSQFWETWLRGWERFCADFTMKSEHQTSGFHHETLMIRESVTLQYDMGCPGLVIFVLFLLCLPLCACGESPWGNQPTHWQRWHGVCTKTAPTAPTVAGFNSIC